MMRRREIRGYNRYSGVTTGPSSQLKTAGLAIVVVSGVVGLCGLTTIVAQQTDQLESSKVAQKDTSDAEKTAVAAADVFSTEPAAMLQTVQVTNTKKKATSTPTNTTKVSRITCNKTLHTAAIQKQAANLKKESLRHQRELRSLQTTGFITKFFNPSLYGRRLDKENTQHKNVTKYIHTAFKHDVEKAHC